MYTIDQIIGAPLPAATSSYVPVSHKVLIERVKEKLDKAGLIIEHERYDANDKITQMFGCFSVGMGNSEQRMSVGFRNSYDKSLAVGLVSGAQVIVCSNLMFVGDIKLMRKHTTNVFQDMDTLIDTALAGASTAFSIIQDETAVWKG
jgi:hypothetical protein